VFLFTVRAIMSPAGLSIRNKGIMHL